VSWVAGIELTPAEVRVATMSSAAALDAPVEAHPPILYCEAEATWAGRDALETGAGKGQGFVEDVVGEFTVDRLFLTAGRLLTPDQALRELLWGIVVRPARVRSSWPDALTVSCPPQWDAAVLARVEAIVTGLRLPLPRVVSAVDAASAAADAFSRLPTSASLPTAAALDMPSMHSGFTQQFVLPPPGEPVVPHETKVRSGRLGLLASVLAVLTLVAVLAVVVLHNRAHDVPVIFVPRPVAGSAPAAVAILSRSRLDHSRGAP
jgi:hypothetical protein